MSKREGGEYSLKQILKKIDWLTVGKVTLVVVLTLAPLAVSYAQSSPLSRYFPCDPNSGQSCKEYDVNSFIRFVINVALSLVFGIAVLMLIVGGFIYMTAGGNGEAADKGRKTVVNALIGIIIVVLSWVVVAAVANFLPRAGGTSGGTP